MSLTCGNSLDQGGGKPACKVKQRAMERSTEGGQIPQHLNTVMGVIVSAITHPRLAGVDGIPGKPSLLDHQKLVNPDTPLSDS